MNDTSSSVSEAQVKFTQKVGVGSQIFYFLRRWPLIPMAIMALL